MKESRIKAKTAIDNIIRKSRVHLYKPIQIAEILYRHRVYKDIDLLKLEDYRTKSKSWRDAMCIPLLGRVCTSSAKFQDNLFDANAIPPEVLAVLGDENIRSGGAVEAYIYNCFTHKHDQLSDALRYCQTVPPEQFEVKDFIESFRAEAGLRRSIDKVYEIVVFALFSTLIEAMHLQIEVSIPASSFPLLKEFEDFSKKVICLDASNIKHMQDAYVYRVGVTNAADRGLDMYSNWGPAIQIKHLTLDVELARNIVAGITSDKVIIVCRDVEKNVIESLLLQIGWKNRIQSIITESDLVRWYDKALRGEYAEVLADNLMDTLIDEMENEFPSVNNIPKVLADRHYETVTDDFWVQK